MAVLAALAAVLVLSSGCNKKASKEANAALEKALSALTRGDKDGFVAAVMPAQREGVTALAEWGFLQEAKSHEIDNSNDMGVTDDSAMIFVTLRPEDEKAFSHIYFVMKKTDGNWLIDLDETIKKERAADSVDAFQWWTIETR